jgi:CheY-like chemotaxis protein
MAHILVVDDEAGLREFAADVLVAAGHTVAMAENVADAVARLEERPFDLALLDLSMPGGEGGLDLLRRIRAEWPATQTVVLTAYGTVGTAVDAMRLGAFEFLEKPIASPAELARHVKRALNWGGAPSSRGVKTAVAAAAAEHVGPGSPAQQAGGTAFRRLLRELKRRHVYNVSVAYAAVAFVTLQLAEAVLPALPLQEWVHTAVVVLVIVGFPIAIVLGWIYDLTDTGLRRTAPLPASDSIDSETEDNMATPVDGSRGRLNREESPRRTGWLRAGPRLRFGLGALFATVLGMTVLPAAATAQGGGFGNTERRQVVEQFDADGDGVLNARERQAALSALGLQTGAARGFGGGRGGRGGSALVPGAPGPRLSPADVAPVPSSVPLYDLSAVRTIFLTFEDDGWEREMAAFYNTDVQIPVTAVIDGVTYQDVGVRFRGASSFRMVPEGSKRPLRLKMDLVHDQHVGGYRTLNLLNLMNDPSFVRTVLYSQIAREYIAAPPVNFVRVVINGESWGIYLNAQQFNRDFINDFFEATAGARWKVPGSPNGRGGLEYLGENLDAYRRIYQIDTRDDAQRWADLIELSRVLSQTPLDRLVEALDPILDIDAALRFLALEVALVNSDGYWTRASDYTLYQDPNGRFHIVPHDMNEGLAGNVRLDPLVGLNDPSKPLRSRLLAVPELRERYLDYVREIAEQWLDWDRLGPMVAQHQSLISADVAADTRKLYSTQAFTDSVASLRAFVQQRREFLLSR